MGLLRSRSLPMALLALLTCGHFLLLAHYVRPAYASPDADGYYSQARLIFQEGRLTFRPASPAQHLGMHWLEKPDGGLISRYPAGLPVLIGALWTAAGRDASLYLNAILAALTLPALYLLAAPYAGVWGALAAAALQAANPIANFHAIFADSHTAAGFFLILGWLLLDRSRRLSCKWLGMAGGFSLAVVPTIRYAEAAAAIGVLVYLAALWRQGRRDVFWPVLGALPPALALAAVNTAQFGAPWRTAYALTRESNLAWAYFLQNWQPYIEAILTSGVGLFAVLGALGAFAMLRERETRPIALGLGGSALAITLVYMAYYSNAAGGPSGARFLLPTLPLYLPPAIWFLHRAFAGRAFALALTALTVLQIAMGLPGGLERMRRQAAQSERAADLIVALEESVPKGAVLLADPRVEESIHFTGEWKLADLSLFSGDIEPMRFGPRSTDPNRPASMQRGKGKTLRARYDGLDERDRTALLLADLEAWANPDSEIYLVASDRGPDEPVRLLRRAASLEAVVRVELPQAEVPRPRLVPGRRRPPGVPMAGIPGGELTIYRVRPR